MRSRGETLTPFTWSPNVDTTLSGWRRRIPPNEWHHGDGRSLLPTGSLYPSDSLILQGDDEERNGQTSTNRHESIRSMILYLSMQQNHTVD
jgi:hypothetical protein